MGFILIRFQEAIQNVNPDLDSLTKVLKLLVKSMQDPRISKICVVPDPHTGNCFLLLFLPLLIESSLIFRGEVSG